ncbi:MAG: sulfotransferase [Dongiaceae bacterium]
MARLIIMEQTFAGRLAEPEHAKDVFRRHNAAVMAEVAGDRLLLFNVAAGWSPLCRFLDRPVPKEPFPRTNSSEEFWQHTLPSALDPRVAGDDPASPPPAMIRS